MASVKRPASSAMPSADAEDLFEDQEVESGKLHPVWDFFKRHSNEKKSKCKVVQGKALCGKMLQSVNSTNLKEHLKSRHLSVWKVVTEREQKWRKSNEQKKIKNKT